MKSVQISNINQWMRQKQSVIAMLLSVAFLLNTLPAFAVVSKDMPLQPHVSLHNDQHLQHSSCSNDMSHEKQSCCQGNHNTCMMHCASLVMMMPLSLPTDMPIAPTNSAPTVQPDNMPLPYVFPPPQRPPRA